jgi:hypothetical protein
MCGSALIYGQRGLERGWGSTMFFFGLMNIAAIPSHIVLEPGPSQTYLIWKVGHARLHGACAARPCHATTMHTRACIRPAHAVIIRCNNPPVCHCVRAMHHAGRGCGSDSVCMLQCHACLPDSPCAPTGRAGSSARLEHSQLPSSQPSADGHSGHRRAAPGAYTAGIGRAPVHAFLHARPMQPQGHHPEQALCTDYHQSSFITRLSAPLIRQTRREHAASSSLCRPAHALHVIWCCTHPCAVLLHSTCSAGCMQSSDQITLHHTACTHTCPSATMHVCSIVHCTTPGCLWPRP